MIALASRRIYCLASIKRKPMSARMIPTKCMHIVNAQLHCSTTPPGEQKRCEGQRDPKRELPGRLQVWTLCDEALPSDQAPSDHPENGGEPRDVANRLQRRFAWGARTDDWPRCPHGETERRRNCELDPSLLVLRRHRLDLICFGAKLQPRCLNSLAVDRQTFTVLDLPQSGSLCYITRGLPHATYKQN